MEAPRYKTGHIIFFRGNDWDKNLSPEELQRVTGQFMAWFERLTREGKAIGGAPLENEGKIVSGSRGRSVSDGPFAESKEAIGGYFMLDVESMEEAIKIAQQCPILEYGAKVEVRPVAQQCVQMRRAEQLAATSA
jgi:hypothetical protein